MISTGRPVLAILAARRYGHDLDRATGPRGQRLAKPLHDLDHTDSDGPETGNPKAKGL